MQKVLFVSHLANFQKFNQPLIQRFKQDGWMVDYVSSNEEKITNCDEVYEVKINRSPLSLTNIRAVFKLKRILNQNHYDLIHCHTPMGGVVARLANFLAGKNRTKIVYTAHGFHFFKGAPRLNWLLFYPVEKILARITNAIITINQEDYQLAKQKFKTRVFKIDGVGINLERFKSATKAEKSLLRKQYGYKAQDFILIYVAELIKRKNHAMILRNLNAIIAQIPNLRLIFVGGATNQAIYQQISQSDRVDFLGYRDDVDKLFQLSDVAITTSFQEGLATNVIEAMASGLPIICSDVRGHHDLIEDGKGGYLFSLNDDNSLTSSVIKLYQGRGLVHKFSAHNLREVTKYDQKTAVKRTFKIYHEVLNEK